MFVNQNLKTSLSDPSFEPSTRWAIPPTSESGLPSPHR
jgi:hypothetical protein